MAAHESPRTTKLYDRTTERLTQDEVEAVEGLLYAFPRRTKAILAGVPHVAALHQAIAQRPRIRAYLRSGRRLPFNEQGIFRHYPELDG